MAELLLFLAARYGFLFEPDRFRIVDTSASRSFGDAAVVMEDAILRLTFTRDRGQFLFECQPLDGNPEEWFSNGLLRGWLKGDRGGSEVLTEDDDWPVFLQFAIPEFEAALLDPARREPTLDALRTQASLRSEELFGLPGSLS